jgi:hypothetical protein
MGRLRCVRHPQITTACGRRLTPKGCFRESPRNRLLLTPVPASRAHATPGGAHTHRSVRAGLTLRSVYSTEGLHQLKLLPLPSVSPARPLMMRVCARAYRRRRVGRRALRRSRPRAAAAFVSPARRRPRGAQAAAAAAQSHAAPAESAAPAEGDVIEDVPRAHTHARDDSTFIKMGALTSPSLPVRQRRARRERLVRHQRLPLRGRRRR